MRRGVLLCSALLFSACGDDDAPGTNGTDDSSTGSSGQADDTTSNDQASASGESSDDETSTTNASSTDPGTESTGAAQCSEDDACVDARAPLCIEGTCVACDAAPNPDAACAQLGDGTTPICAEGRCVQCTADSSDLCTGATPICDVDQNLCVGCTDHAQCPDSACRISEGECFPTDPVVYVDGDAACEGADGTPANPHCTIGDALDDVGPGQTATILLAHTTLPYAEALEIDTGRTIAILGGIPGESESAPTLSLNSAAPLARVGGAASSLYLQRVRLQGNLSGPGLEVSEGQAYLDRVEILSNTGSGVIVQGGHVQLRNAIVGRNGDSFAATRGIDVQDGTFTVVYGSVIANEGDSEDDTLRCDASSAGTIRNTILLGAELDSVTCPDLEITFSAVDSQALSGEGVDDVTTFDPDWFVSVALADFHLQDAPRTPFAELARWQTGDPRLDLDGDERPARNGSADYAGADTP